MLTELSRNFLRLTFGATVLLTAFLCVPEAKADNPFNISFIIGSDTGTISITNATDQGGGVFNATSGTLTVTGGLAIGTYSLVSGGPLVTTSPTGAFLF